MRPLTEVWPLSTTSHCPVVGFHMRRVQSPDPLTMRPSPSTATDVTTCATHHHAAAHPALSKHDETQDSAQKPMFNTAPNSRHHSISNKTIAAEDHSTLHWPHIQTPTFPDTTNYRTDTLGI